MRLILDSGFSDNDYKLIESDFYAYDDTKSIIIRIYLSNIKEDCVVARMHGKLSNDGDLVIEYRANIDCAEKLFNSICTVNVKYHKVATFQDLIDGINAIG